MSFSQNTSGFTLLGKASKTTFLMDEEYKIAFECTASGAMFKGQPVKLTTAGKVSAWASTDLQHLLFGFLTNDCADGDLVTVITRGFAMIFAIANAASQNAGIGTYKGYDTTHNATDGAITTGYSLWGAATDVTDTVGWILDQSTAQYALIRVLLKD